jgi:alpha-glucosidase
MNKWWPEAVFYQIYVRSFCDSNGDGIGDLPGITSKLDYLQALGVQALWLTPFYPSPQADHGYDVSNYVDVDPLFGTLADFDELVTAAHKRGLRVIVDIVPNQSSSQHPWFTGPDRARRYVTVQAEEGRKGRDEPPNNWPSVWGGPAWTLDEQRGEWYLHLFSPHQPDLDWNKSLVQEDFNAILRFWLDRGVDGFRVDVAHGLVKDPTLANEPEPFAVVSGFAADWRQAIDRPEVHEIYRSWRSLLTDYGSEKVLIGEVVLSDQRRVAKYLRPDELHLSFNFSLLFQPWEAEAIRASIDEALRELPVVTWVFENHDVTRIASRFGGERQARAAALLLLALPGAAFLYQGQELGLEEVDLPDDVRQDPVFSQSSGARKGRDGCRVPIPWARELPVRSWLPQPRDWSEKSVAAQAGTAESFLELYRSALELRPSGQFRWRKSPEGTLAFDRDRLTCIVHFTDERIPFDGDALLASDETNTAVWLRRR